MGRELKRVPLDFKWPEDQLWKGYINPYHSQVCKPCKGEGLNPATKQLSDDWYDFDRTGARWCNDINQTEVDALVESGRLKDFTHTFVPGEGWKEKEPKYTPTAEEINRWNAGPGFGHDAVNRWICVESRAKQLGIYGVCEFCSGEGEIWQNEEVKKLHDEWMDFDPPTGEGYQLWSTTTEGHPMSPVFETLELLCEYLEKNMVSVFGNSTASKDEWYKMLDDGFVSYSEGNATFI